MCDDRGRPRLLVLSDSQVSDFKGAVHLLSHLPPARTFLADRGYDADWLRDGLHAHGITPSIPGKKSRPIPIEYDKTMYKQHHKIEIMFGRLKDWRPIANIKQLLGNTFFNVVMILSCKEI